MKAKTRRIVSLVLAAAMTLTSLTFVNAADSVNADLAGEFKVTINAPLDKSAADTYHFSNEQIAIQAERAINDKGNQSDPQIEELPVGTKTQKIRPYYRVTTKVAGSLSIEHEDVGDKTGKHIVVIKVEDPKGPGSIDESPLTETYSLVKDFTMVTGTNVETTDPVDPGVYVIGTSGGNYAIKSIAISGDAVTAGTGEAGTAKQPTEPSKEIVPSESPYYTGDTYQLLDTYNPDDTIAKDALLHKDKFEFSLSSGGVVCLDPEVGVKAIQDNKSCPTFGGSYMKSYKIHALEDGKITIEYAPLGTKTLALGEAATGDDSANVTLVGDPIIPTQEQVKKLQTLVINAKKDTYYYFGGNATAPQIVSVKYEGDGGSVTPPPVTTSGTISFTAVVNDEDKTVESDGTFTVDIFVEASADTPVNNADFVFNFNKDVAKVVSAKRLADGAELGAEPTEDLPNPVIDSAQLTNENSVYWGKNDLENLSAYESGIIKVAFFLNAGTVITTERQKVATLELQAIAEGTVDPSIDVKDCMSAPNSEEAQKNWMDKTANPDVSVDAPAIDNVTVTESQPTPPPGPTDPNSLIIDPASIEVEAGSNSSPAFNIVLDNVETPVNNGTFWIFYNGDATNKSGASAGKGTDYVIADSLKVINLGATAVDSPIDLTWKISDANLEKGEEYVADDKDKTPAEVGKLKAAFRIQKNATPDSNQIEAGDLIPDEGVTSVGIAQVAFKLKDGAPAVPADDEIRIPITLKVVDFAGVPTYENGVLSYDDVPTNDEFVGYIVIKGKESSQPTTESSTSTTEAPKPDDSTSTSTTEAPKPDDSSSTTTTQAQQPTNPPATEGSSEATTSRPVTPGGSSGGGGGGGGSAHRSTTTATTEAATEAVSSGEVETGEAAPDEEKPAGAVAEFLNAEGYHFAYMVGYPDGSFGPNRNVTRGEIAAVFARLITGDINVGSNSASYSDIAGNEWYADYIGYLEDLDVIAGYTDGTFGPNRPITRAEFAALLSKFTGSASASDATFTDVAGHWAAAQIAAAVKAGWMSGYPDKTFKPNAYITRAELVSAINRATGRTPDVTATSGITFTDVPNGAWYANDVAEAVTEHWYTGKEKWYLSEDEYNAAVAPSEEEASEETTEAASEAASGETAAAEEKSTTEGETSDETTEAVTEAAAESTTKEDSTEPSA